MTRLWIAGRHPSHPNPSGPELCAALTNHLGVNATVVDHFGGGYHVEVNTDAEQLFEAAKTYLDFHGIDWEVRTA